MQKTLYAHVQRAVENINKGLPRPKYQSARDFIVAAVVDLLEKEGQGQLEKPKIKVKA